MSTERDEKFNAIVKEYEERILDKLPKHQLDDYVSFLTKCGSHNGFNVDTYNRICDYINSLLMHQETQNKLEELKKSHWTVGPNFWFTSVAAISGVVGCILTWNSARQPKIPSANGIQQSAASSVRLPQKKTEHQQNILKPISSSAASHGQGSFR